jgi:hypothetical protein
MKQTGAYYTVEGSHKDVCNWEVEFSCDFDHDKFVARQQRLGPTVTVLLNLKANQGARNYKGIECFLFGM